MRVRLFGGLALELDGVPVGAPTARRARVLLGWLAVHPGMHDRRELAARLRPDVLDDSAQASLRQALWAVRLAAGPAVAATRTQVGLLRGDAVRVDLWDVDRLLSGGDVEAALALVESGTLLEGLDEEWVYDAREDHRLRLAQALGDAGDAAERAGDLGRALALARRWVAFDPLTEHAHRALIRRLAATGDAGAAVRAYDVLVRRLREELGVGPSRETRDLVTAIRGAAPVPAQAMPDASAPVPLRLPARRSSRRFVGRESELSWLEEQWRETQRAGPVLALVTGEAGIGKTRLVSELCRRLHARGAQVLYGSSAPDPLVSYEPFVVALRHYVTSCPPDAVAAQVGARAPLLAAVLPEVPQPPGAPGIPPDRLRLFDAVVGLIATMARTRPLLLVLDDLHWADPGTVLLLQHLVRTAERIPLLVVALYRPTDLRPAVADALGELPRLTRLPQRALSGLGQDDVDALLTTWTGDDPPPGLAGSVWTRTRGNPFFVEEVVEHLIATGALSRRAGQWAWDLAREDVTIPTAVAQVIRRRVDRLQPRTRALVATGAVFGLSFPVATVQRALGFDDAATADAVDEAVATGLLAQFPEVSDRCAFVHPLTRETVYDELSQTRRGTLHRGIAEALGDAATSAERAHHLVRAAAHGVLVDEAIRFAVAAGEDAMQQRAYEDAVRWFDEALTVMGEGDVARRREVLSRRGVALTAQWHVLRDGPLLDRAPR